MEPIVVQSSSHTYQIVVGENLRFNIHEYLPKDYSTIMVITDETVARLYLDDVLKGLAHHRVYHSVIPAGEQSKNIDMYYQLQTDAISNGLDRRSLIVALGGGVVGDLAGFVAATFMRGIDYIQVPTTILAHDSSVGGKVAINHEQGKNLIGSFYPPRAVIYDVNTLTSLSPNEIRSGYAELVKEALISDHLFFSELMEAKLDALTNDELVRHIQKGIQVKAKVVEADEKESGMRKFLNLGHTLGHALEAILGYGRLTHGEAVAIGLLFALQLSEDTFAMKLPRKPLKAWMEANHYPMTLPKLDVNEIISVMKKDKKAVNSQIQMVLLEEVGRPTVVDFSDEAMRKALNTFLGELIEK